MAKPRDPNQPTYRDRFLGRTLEQWVAERFKGNISSAARWLGVGRDLLWGWIRGESLPSEKHWPKLKKLGMDFDVLRELETLDVVARLQDKLGATPEQMIGWVYEIANERGENSVAAPATRVG